MEPPDALWILACREERRGAYSALMLKRHDDLNTFARSDNLDITEAFQIKEMPVSGHDQGCAVLLGKRKEKVIGWVCLDDVRN